MSNYRTIWEYRDDRATYGKQRFLSLYASPVLLTPNPNPEPKPATLGGSEFYTRAQSDPTGPSDKAGKKSPLVVNDSFIVIPIVKNEGHPFPERIGVGRTKGTDITLASREVSKYQGYFSVAGERWSFTDGGSSNGSFIRGVRLAPTVATAVDDGTEIGFGAGRYIFRTAAGFCEFLAR